MVNHSRFVKVRLIFSDHLYRRHNSEDKKPWEPRRLNKENKTHQNVSFQEVLSSSLIPRMDCRIGWKWHRNFIFPVYNPSKDHCQTANKTDRPREQNACFCHDTSVYQWCGMGSVKFCTGRIFSTGTTHCCESPCFASFKKKKKWKKTHKCHFFPVFYQIKPFFICASATAGAFQGPTLEGKGKAARQCSVKFPWKSKVKSTSEQVFKQKQICFSQIKAQRSLPPTIQSLLTQTESASLLNPAKQDPLADVPIASFGSWMCGATR